MSIKKTSIAIGSSVLMALSGVSAHATDVDKNNSKQSAPKEQKVGMATGTLAGALIGGPFGAGIGFIIGSIVGTGASQMHKAEHEAMATKRELAAAQLALTELTAQQVELQTALQASVNASASASANKKSAEDAKSAAPSLDQLAQQLRADVLFRTASAELDSGAVTKLNDLGAVLVKYPNLSIDVDGYADPRGKAGENLELSQQRALAVRAALIVGGANPESIRITAHGEQLSTAAKNDADAYAWERRASLSVTTSTPSAVAQTK